MQVLVGLAGKRMVGEMNLADAVLVEILISTLTELGMNPMEREMVGPSRPAVVGPWPSRCSYNGNPLFKALPGVVRFPVLARARHARVPSIVYRNWVIRVTQWASVKLYIKRRQFAR